MAGTGAGTVTEPRPLSEAERKTLAELLDREAKTGAGQAPSTRTGQPWQALVNLSLPRRGDKDHKTDLVMAGEVVYLTDEEAAQFNRHGGRDGRQVEVLRRVPGGVTGNTVPRVAPRAVSGRVNQPPPPPPGSDAPRPDPPGSSAIQYAEPAIPEAHEPTAGTENVDHGDAVDLPPRQQRARR